MRYWTPKNARPKPCSVSEQRDFSVSPRVDIPSLTYISLAYAFDMDREVPIPAGLIRTLIDRFLTRRFGNTRSDLNSRSQIVDPYAGSQRWLYRDIIIHLKTKQVTKVPSDRVGYRYDKGDDEPIPLAFFIDMSSSMIKYNALLATMMMELLRRGITVFIGYNEIINDKVTSIDDGITILKMQEFLDRAQSVLKVDTTGIHHTRIEDDIVDYLEAHGCECLVAFTDFDPRHQLFRLSREMDVYWFCFEENMSRYPLNRFQGYLKQVRCVRDVVEGLSQMGQASLGSRASLDKYR